MDILIGELVERGEPTVQEPEPPEGARAGLCLPLHLEVLCRPASGAVYQHL